MKNVFRWSLSIFGTFAGVVYAAPVTPPAGSYIVNTSTSPVTFPTFNVSSGSVRQQLNLPYIASGNCLQTTTGGKVVSAGAACGSGGGGGGMTPGATYYLQNTSTLQTGATAYPYILYVASNPYMSAYNTGGSDFIFDMIKNGSLIGRIDSAQNDMFFGSGNGAVNLNIRVDAATNSMEFRNATSASNINHKFNTSGNDGEYDWENVNNRFNFINNVNVPNLTATYNASVSSLTVTNFANFTGVQPSSFTFGVIVGSLTTQGTSDGNIEFTVSGTTYTATISSTTNTAFHMAGWNGTQNQLIDIGLPIAPGGFGTINAGTLGALSYYNIAGSTLSAVPGTLVTASSVTLPQTIITSSFGVVVGGGVLGNTPAALNVYVANDTIGQTKLINVGSLQHVDQFYCLDKTVCHSEYGIQSNDLNLGNSATGVTKLQSIQSTNQFVDLYNSGEIDIQTAAFANADIAFKPKTVERFRLSFSTGAVVVGATANKWTLATSTNTSASYTDANLQVTISTNGAIGPFGRSLAQLATIVPSKVFDVFGCVDCTTDALCVATQTVTASWAKTGARTTACQ